MKDLGHRQKAASSRKVVEKEKVADRKMVARLGEEKNKKVKKVGPDELEVEVELSQAGAKARSHRRSLCAIRLSRYQPNQERRTRVPSAVAGSSAARRPETSCEMNTVRKGIQTSETAGVPQTLSTRQASADP